MFCEEVHANFHIHSFNYKFLSVGIIFFFWEIFWHFHWMLWAVTCVYIEEKKTFSLSLITCSKDRFHARTHTSNVIFMTYVVRVIASVSVTRDVFRFVITALIGLFRFCFRFFSSLSRKFYMCFALALRLNWMIYRNSMKVQHNL